MMPETMQPQRLHAIVKIMIIHFTAWKSFGLLTNCVGSPIVREVKLLQLFGCGDCHLHVAASRYEIVNLRMRSLRPC